MGQFAKPITDNRKINRKESMDILVERLNAKLREWEPNIAAEVREQISEIIDLADQNALDIMRSRAVEQEVLDLLDSRIYQWDFALDLETDSIKTKNEILRFYAD